MVLTLRRTATFAALFFTAAPAWCVQSSGSVDARANVVVRVEHGAVEVHGESGAKTVTWSTKPHTHTFVPKPLRRHSASDDGSGGEIEFHAVGDRVEIYSARALDLSVTVPEATRTLRIETGQGDVTVRNVSGEVRVATQGGKVSAERTGALHAYSGGGDMAMRHTGALKLETGGGNVEVDAAGGEVNAVSGGGNMVVTAAKGSVALVTNGGNVTVRQADGAAKLQTNGGNIEMGDIGSDVQASTGSGNIRLASAKGMVQASTLSGSIECRQLGAGLRAETSSGHILAQYASSAKMVSSQLSSGSGDITVYVPAAVAASVRVDAATPWGHSIRSDFADVHVQQGDGQLHAAGALNGGGPQLRVAAQNGSVQLLRER